MPILLDQQHPISKRFAIVDDDAGHGAWLYITQPDFPRPYRDALVLSLRAPIPLTEVRKNMQPDGPPPVAEGFLDPAAVERSSDIPMSFRWSRDGHAVCVIVRGVPRAIAAASRDSGMSRDLIKSGPWGEPWDEATFIRLFA